MNETKGKQKEQNRLQNVHTHCARSLSKLDFDRMCLREMMIETNKWTTLYELFKANSIDPNANKKAICQIAEWCYWNSNSIEKFGQWHPHRNTAGQIERREWTIRIIVPITTWYWGSRTNEMHASGCARLPFSWAHTQWFQSIQLKTIEWNIDKKNTKSTLQSYVCRFARHLANFSLIYSHFFPGVWVENTRIKPSLSIILWHRTGIDEQKRIETKRTEPKSNPNLNEKTETMRSRGVCACALPPLNFFQRHSNSFQLCS